MMLEQLRMSPPILIESYNESLIRSKEYLSKEPPRLVLRERHPANETGELLKLLQEQTNALKAALIDFPPDEGEDQEDAMYKLREQLDKKYELGRTGAYFLALGDVGIISPDHAMRHFIVEDVLTSITAEAFAKEYPGKPNPFSPLAQIYDEGVWPHGFRTIGGKQAFVVHVPITFKTDVEEQSRTLVMMGCWADGDEELNYVHSFEDDCRFNMDVNMGEPRQVEESGHSFYMTDPKPLEFAEAE